ncbi:MAG: hypothetical protein WC645_02815 [Candidatus Margulisiibacteriota bacterium]
MTRRLVISLVLALLLMGGCSRTVTSIVDFGSQLSITANFRDTIDVTNNRYFVVFSTVEAYSIPLPPPDSTDEFLEPGAAPRVGDMTTYFSKYYSTWTAYIIVDSLGYSLARGPFTVTDPVTRETFAGLGTVGSSISFTIRLDQIFGASVPQNVVFDIIAVEYPADSLKILRDRISPPVRKIEKTRGSVLTESPGADTSISGSLDITSWTAKIE